MDRSKIEYVRKPPALVRFAVGFLIVVFGIGFLLNMYLAINGMLHERGVPHAFGFTPIVVAESEGDEYVRDMVKPGDLLFAVDTGIKTYDVGDSVAFYRGNYILIGEIVEARTSTTGIPSFRVKAVYEKNAYNTPATEDNMIGKISVQIPELGFLVLFMASIPGKVIFVGIPLLMYLIMLFVSDQVVRKEHIETEAEKRARARIAGASNPLWTVLLVTMPTVAAIIWGTRRLQERKPKKPKLQRGELKPEPECPFKPLLENTPGLITQSQSCHPVRMRANRAVKPVKLRPVAKAPSYRVGE